MPVHHTERKDVPILTFTPSQKTTSIAQCRLDVHERKRAR